jgi:hypothetical protein
VTRNLRIPWRINAWWMAGIPLFFLALFIVNPLWFTNSKNSIDPWIYWGAGDEPRLSYQNDFARTYYLQRYVVILPKILLFEVFGSFWGQLAVAIFWMVISAYFMFQLVSKILSQPISYSLIFLFFTDSVLIGNFGNSYTMAPTIAFYFMISFYVVKILAGLDKQKENRASLLLGAAVACQLNAYMTHGLICLFVLCCFSIKNRKRISRIVVKLTLLGVLVTTFIFQVTYSLISKDPFPFFLKQFLYGMNLATTENPWGSRGFFDFWASVFGNSLTYYWLAIFALGFTLIFLRKSDTSINGTSKELNNFASLLFFAFFLQTLFYTNIFGYSWVACGLYPIKFIVMIALVKIIRSFVSEQLLVIGLVSAAVYSLFLVKYSDKFRNANLVSNSFTLILLLLAGILITQQMSRFLGLRVSKLVEVLVSISLILNLVFLQNLPLFRQYAVSFETSFDEARREYQLISERRKIILEISESINHRSRSWLTPGSTVPLISSQLYMYSLISTSNQKSNCAQVNWAANYKSLLFSFDAIPIDKTQLNKLYLNECGYQGVDVYLEPKLLEKLRAVNGKVWGLQAKN